MWRHLWAAPNKKSETGNLTDIVIVIITVDNSALRSVEPVEHGPETSDNESLITQGNTSSDSTISTSAPRLMRSKSSNCFQRASAASAKSERRFFLPSIDRRGNVSAQRRPATSDEVRLNNERRTDVGDDVHRPPRAPAGTVWNSLTSMSPISSNSPTDLTLQPVTSGSFVPNPPPRKNSNSNNWFGISSLPSVWFKLTVTVIDK